MVGISLLWIVVTILLVVLNLVFLSGAEPAEALVVEVLKEQDRDLETKYRARLEFVTLDGQTVDFESKSSKFVPKPIGERMNVLYDPDDPDRVVIDTFEEKWYTAMLSAGLHFFWVVFTIMVVKNARKKRQAEVLDELERGVVSDISKLRDGVDNYIVEPSQIVDDDIDLSGEPQDPAQLNYLVDPVTDEAE